jgi:hypothetical protein
MQNAELLGIRVLLGDCEIVIYKLIIKMVMIEKFYFNRKRMCFWVFNSALFAVLELPAF